MVLIVSQSPDVATQKVIQWLRYYKVSFVLLDEHSKINLVKASLNQFIIDVGDRRIDSDDITAFWYRSGDMCFELPDLKSDFSELQDSLCEFQKTELSSIVDFFYYILEAKANKIGSIRFNNINKLRVLSLAQKCGLSVPDTVITANISALNKFSATHNKLISKPITDVYSFFDIKNKLSTITYTRQLQISSITTDTFQPSLVQENIEKRYEVRVFYLQGAFYAMAIFSQSNAETSVDFRMKHSSLIRCVPYSLPKNIEEKLQVLMNKLDFDTGSIDLIKAHDGHYYFLEVNPFGIFTMVSESCNFYLEHVISQKLMNE